jgi:hypothetical protein
MGLGALAFDMLLALVATSLLRARLGYRSWRAVHWLAYVSWPVALLHGVGTGSDVKQAWMLVLTIVCLAAVVTATALRAARADAPEHVRAGWLAATFGVPVALAGFTVLGPLQRGWAKKAGTPTTLIAKAHAQRIVVTAAAPRIPVSRTISRAFTAHLTGTLRELTAPGGAVIQLTMRMSGGMAGLLRIRLGGIPDPSGGLSLSGSQVDLAGAGMPAAMQGRVTSLQGEQLAATVTGARGGVLNLQATLNIDNASHVVTGVLRGEPAA